MNHLQGQMVHSNIDFFFPEGVMTLNVKGNCKILY